MSWRSCTVGDFVEAGVADIQTGPFGTQLKASDYVQEGTPVINVRNIGFGPLKPEKLEYVNEDTALRLAVHLLERGDIVFGRKGAVERHLFVGEEQEGWMQGSDCIRLRFRTEDIHPRFISYSFLMPTHQKWMLVQSGSKATMASLNHDIIKRIPLRVPPPDVQQDIVEVLSAYDDLIENNWRRISLLEQAARMIYKEWFVHLRFSGHEHAKITDGLPEGWEKKQVKSIIGKVRRNKKIKKSEYQEFGPIPCVDQSRDFIGGYTDDEESVIDEGRPVIVFGDHTRILKFVDFRFACGADGTQLIVSQDESLSQEYLYFALDAVDLSNYFYARHFKFLKDQYVLIPSQIIRDQFTDVAKPLMQKIKTLREMNVGLSQSRDLLLPRLMNGEIAV